MSEVATITPAPPPPINVTALIPQNMDQAIRLAQVMASAKLVPKHLQGDVGSCFMVVEQSMRWGMSPFAVAQATSSISGKLMFEGKLVAAAVESCGAIEGHFDYNYAGDGDTRQITVSARRRGDVNPRQLTIKYKDVRTANEWWKKQPDQMLAYSGVRNWARRFTPSVLLGVYSPEEFNRDSGQIVTIDGEQPVVEQPSRRDQINAEVPIADTDPLEVRSLAQWRLNLKAALTSAQTLEEVEAISAHRRVLDALNRAPKPIIDEVTELLDEAHKRFAPPEDDNWPDDPIRELLADIATMDTIRLNQLPTDAQWRARVRDATSFPLDEDRLNEAIAARIAELR